MDGQLEAPEDGQRPGGVGGAGVGWVRSPPNKKSSRAEGTRRTWSFAERRSGFNGMVIREGRGRGGAAASVKEGGQGEVPVPEWRRARG